MIILGIESSCDDTSAAVIKDGVLLSNVTASQAVHEAYGGVVPELASRAHQQNIVPVVDHALKKAGVEREELAMAIDSVQDTVSMFEPIFQDGTDTVCVMDQIHDNINTHNAWEQTITINEAMKKLPEREQMIINLRFFEGHTQTEIAEEIGISQAQISRLEKNALKHLRKYV
mgnify:CR=1 FL=1